jgi:hypothetical protein
MPLRRYRAALVGAATTCVVAVGGCGTAQPAASPPASVVTSPVPVAEVARADPGRPRTGPADPQLGVAYPYDLYTHCGIRYAQFGGRWWEVSPPRAEPAARAGADGVTRYTGYTAGTMTLVGTDVARFVVDVRHAAPDDPVVTFFPASGQPPPCE